MDSLAHVAFEKVRNLNSAAGVRDYLKKYPGSDYESDAVSLLEELERRSWEKAERLGTVVAYRTYLGEFPNGAHKYEADERIKSILDPWYGWERESHITGDTPDCGNFGNYFDHNLDNYLDVHVGNSIDVAIKVMEQYTDKCVRFKYIQGGSTLRFPNIPEGKYYLKIAYGRDFVKKYIGGECFFRFKTNGYYEKGEDILNFNVIKTWDGEQIPSFELWLDVSTSAGHKFDAYKISEAEFNR
ncbi:MAG: hypothetical protein U0176_18820 [Bacteroidia bacterium]